MLGAIQKLASMPFAMRVSLFTRIFLIALSFVTVLTAARLYGPVASGQIGLLVAILGITSVVALGGCQMLVLKQLSGDAENRNIIFTSCLVRVMIGVLLVGVLLAFVVVPKFGETYESALGPMLLWLLPVVVAVNTFRVFLFETLRSREAIVGYNVLLLVGALALFIGLLLVPYLLPGASLAWLVVISETLGLCMVAAMLLTNGRGLKLVRISLSNLRVRAGPYHISALSVAIYQLDIFIVGFLVPTDQLGVYVIASRLAGIVALPKVTAGIGYAPEVSRIFRTDGRDEAIAHTRQYTRALVPLSLLLAAFIIAAAPFLLEFLGPAFSDGYAALVMLVAANLVLAVTGHSGILMMMVGYEKLQQLNFVVSAAVMLTLLFFLVPEYGINGGGIAIICGAIVRALFGTIAVQKIFGTGISAFHVFSLKKTVKTREKSE